MLLGGTRARTRALVTAVLTITTIGGALAVATPAAADDSGNAEAYYAAQARSAPERPSDEQQNRYLAEGLAGSVTPLGAADAVPSKFVDGDLVSDAVFFKGNAWSVATIQNLLATKGSGCHATSEAVCLKDYTANTPAKAGGTACNAYPGQTGATAAQIFSAVGVACGINPAVLVALVQKEQGLVSTSAPTKWMYDHATGWLCPDVGADPDCDNTPTSTGFFNQVFGAAWQFKHYGIDPYFKWIPVGKVTPIAYNLDSGCGTKKVAVQNKATAALYYYTPYTPNAASLASYPGAGDDCSAYGIRNFWMLFNAWYGSSTAGSVPPSTRVAGGDRFETAAAISRAAFPAPSAGTVTAFVASGLDFPDALSAAPAAAKAGGPLLLTMPTAVPAATMNELKRLKPKLIYVAGGPAVITQSVLGQLATVQTGQKVARLAGSSRFDTSIQIAKKVFSGGAGNHTAYLASGLGFPDALSAGGAAGANGQPVILINGGLTTADTATVQALRTLGVTTVKIVGGTSIISSGFQSSLASQGFTVSRKAGADRFDTSTVVNQDAFGAATTPAAYFASGTTFPDALAGAAWAGVTHSPLLVTPSWCLYPGTAAIALRSKAFITLGGTSALGPQVGALSVCQ